MLECAELQMDWPLIELQYLISVQCVWANTKVSIDSPGPSFYW